MSLTKSGITLGKLTELLKGTTGVDGRSIRVEGKFDPVRAERVCERHGCSVRYIKRKQWQPLGRGQHSPYGITTATIFEFPAVEVTK